MIDYCHNAHGMNFVGPLPSSAQIDFERQKEGRPA